MNTAKQLDNITHINDRRGEMSSIPMSLRLRWAWSQNTGSSSCKMVLVALAERANDKGLAWPSYAELISMTELNRKTVITAISKLIELNLIEDSGERTGRTAQVIIYRLLINSPKNGTINNNNDTDLGTVNSELNSTVFSSNSTVFSSNSTVFTTKSPKNGTRNPQEPPRTPINPKDIHCDSDESGSVKKYKHAIPNEFSISQEVKNWASKNGFNQLDKRLDHFVDWAKSKNAKYADWDSAFKNAIRGDWAKLNKETSRAGSTPKLSKHSDFNEIDYTAGVNEDGSF